MAATLDFIGLGPTDGMSLGLMMNNAVLWSALPSGMWWWFVPPGLGITMIVGALYIMNVGLDEVFNPKLREMEPPMSLRSTTSRSGTGPCAATSRPSTGSASAWPTASWSGLAGESGCASRPSARA